MMPTRRAVVIDDAEAAEALLGHAHDRFAHRCADGGERQGGVAMHDVADEMKTGAEPAAGMEDVELLRREAAAFEQRDGERIAEGELQQRRGGRREAMRAGLGRARAG